MLKTLHLSFDLCGGNIYVGRFVNVAKFVNVAIVAKVANLFQQFLHQYSLILPRRGGNVLVI